MSGATSRSRWPICATASPRSATRTSGRTCGAATSCSRARGATARRSRRSWEAALPDRLGRTSRVIVRSGAELAAIVRDNPLPEAAADPARLHVVFLDPAPKAAEVRRFDAARHAPNVARFSGREIYVDYPNGFAASKLNDAAWKGLGVTATAPNWTRSRS